MYIPIIDKMQISLSECDLAIRAVSYSILDVAAVIANNVYDFQSRDYYCYNIAALASHFAFNIYDLHFEEFNRLLRERTPFNRWAPSIFTKKLPYRDIVHLRKCCTTWLIIWKGNFPEAKAETELSVLETPQKQCVNAAIKITNKQMKNPSTMSTDFW